jgi:hypothetical protein
LQGCFEEIRLKNGWTNKHIPELISRRENVERIFYILQKQGVIKVDLSTFMMSCPLLERSVRRGWRGTMNALHLQMLPS